MTSSLRKMMPHALLALLSTSCAVTGPVPSETAARESSGPLPAAVHDYESERVERIREKDSWHRAMMWCRSHPDRAEKHRDTCRSDTEH